MKKRFSDLARHKKEVGDPCFRRSIKECMESKKQIIFSIKLKNTTIFEKNMSI